MKMPYERTLAIVETRQFLRELMAVADTPSVPEDIRRQVRSLLRHYPGDAELNLAARVLPHLFAEAPSASSDSCARVEVAQAARA